MPKTLKPVYTIIGMLLSVSIFFILLFVQPYFPGFLSYGYLKKFILWGWLLLIYLFAINIEQQNLLLWPDKKQSARFYILSILAILGLVVVITVAQQVLLKMGLQFKTSNAVNVMAAYLHARPLLLVFTCITASVVEELIFRGYLIPRLAKLLNNTYLAVIISALIFGLGHIGYGTLLNMLAPFLIGLIFGSYYQKYRNLKVLMVCHFIIDFLPFVFY